jgi:hypothetical protein
MTKLLIEDKNQLIKTKKYISDFIGLKKDLSKRKIKDYPMKHIEVLATIAAIDILKEQVKIYKEQEPEHEKTNDGK